MKSPSFASFSSKGSKGGNGRANQTLDLKRKKSNDYNAKKRKGSKGASVMEMDSFLGKVKKNQTFDYKQKVKDISKNDGINNSVLLCLICFDNSPNAVIMDCGHGGVCYDCAIDIMNTQGECFLCRKEIVKVIRVEQDMEDSKILKGVEEANLVEVQDDIDNINGFSFRNPHNDMEDSHLNESHNLDNSFEDHN